ncbi:hypothetical protein DPMN_060747 [Dreissena polymorpha]|uniref:Uncharacterized protein n=1 Tax=Dreissena polymorpha TaxID=45954 RepID=A0A9D4HIJ4_DREPO|nr:hypothetical protein DPMN_060747 [Dreissena polymorpha]
MEGCQIIIDVPQSSCRKIIVLMLGVFHTLINLLGAIAFIIEGADPKTYSRLSIGKMPLCTLWQGKLSRRLCGAVFVLASAYTAGSYQIMKIPRFRYCLIRQRSCTLPFLGARRSRCFMF